MPLKTRDLEQKLVNKFSFKIAPNRSVDHRWYELQIPGCPPVFTKVSHGQREISAKLEGMIARQLRVRKEFLREMVGCTKSAEEYRAQVRDDPQPPFSQRF